MNNTANIIGIVAAVLALGAGVPYVYSILQRKTKPSRPSWGIWTIEGLILFASYYSSGAQQTLWLAGAYTVYPFIMFLLALKYGEGGKSCLDIFCLSGSLLGLGLWVITREPATALYVGLSMSVLGILPTLKKAYLRPETEDTLAWSIAGLAAIVGLFAITRLDFKIIAYPLVTLFINGSVAFLLLLPRRRQIRTKKLTE